MSKISPPVDELLEAAREKRVCISAPLPTSLQMEDAEVIRAYVDAHVRRSIEEWFDSNA